jgi:Na+/H+ antiporter NhaC
MAEHFIVIFFGSIILGIIITLFTYAGEKKVGGNSTFWEKFIKTFLIIFFLLLIGAIMDESGCSRDDDPDYPIKYDPN